MSGCVMLSYNNVTANGFSVAWNYDQDAQNLHVQCTDSPFWAPCSTIDSKLAAAVEGCPPDQNSPLR